MATAPPAQAPPPPSDDNTSIFMAASSLEAIPTSTGGPAIASIVSFYTDASGVHTTLVSNPAYTGPAVSSQTSSFITSTSTPAAAPAAASASSSAAPVTSTDSGLNGAKIAAILVPILVVLALIPVVYLCYLRRRNKRLNRPITPELRLPPTETRLLRSNSRNNSISLPSPFSDKDRIQSTTPFSDKARIQSVATTTYERPESEIQRVPSPTLPSPSLPVFRTQEAWPLTAPLPDIPEPPPSYGPPAASHNASHSVTLRAPTPSYARAIPQEQSPPLTEANMNSHDLIVPSRNNRESDVVSEMSFTQSTGRRRSERDADEVSIVSALSPDDPSERHMHRLF
ncbi:hypothetical protein MMC13_004103 [Lambiella insularis]|nr:hypothetical protein [Lambiella insularis]